MADYIQKVRSDTNYNYGGSTIMISPVGSGGVKTYTFADSPLLSRTLNPNVQYRFFPEGGEIVSQAISVTSSNSGVVAAIPGHAIQILSYTLSVGVNNEAQWLSGASGAISGPIKMLANTSFSYVSEDKGAISTAVGQALNLQTAQNLGGHLTYKIV